MAMRGTTDKTTAGYRLALRARLGECGYQPGGAAAGVRRLAKAGEPRDLTGLHIQIMLSEVLPVIPKAKRAGVIREAGRFLALTMAPMGEADGSAREAARVRKAIAEMAQVVVRSALANQELKRELVKSKSVEAALKESERVCEENLAKSEMLKEQLRWFTRKVLTTQEDERKRISRELHDVIAQALLGINLRLANLKNTAAANSKGLHGNIAVTQRLVTKSADIVHRFARALRPAALDDLGLIPALHSFLKNFTAQTGVRSHLTSFAGVGKLDLARRTVLFRVAQEAMANVARHARATRVDVDIMKTGNRLVMRIADDGVSFSVPAVMNAKGGKRLGLLGMRERLEMVGGSFNIESAPGHGTTVTGSIPFGKSVENSSPPEPPPSIP